jgi:hypothetical protein
MRRELLDARRSGILRGVLTLAILHLAFLSSSSTHAQTEVLCGTPEMTPEEATLVQKQTRKWRQGGVQRTTEVTTILVAVHIVHRVDGTGNVSDQQVAAQVAALNTGFENTNFRFSLCSIDRTTNNEWADAEYESPAEEAMKRELAVDPLYMLNFYILAEPRYSGGSVYGWGTYPWSWVLVPYRHIDSMSILHHFHPCLHLS